MNKSQIRILWNVHELSLIPHGVSEVKNVKVHPSCRLERKTRHQSMDCQTSANQKNWMSEIAHQLNGNDGDSDLKFITKCLDKLTNFGPFVYYLWTTLLFSLIFLSFSWLFCPIFLPPWILEGGDILTKYFRGVMPSSLPPLVTLRHPLYFSMIMLH